jgi:hypothetical protein
MLFALVSAAGCGGMADGAVADGAEPSGEGVCQMREPLGRFRRVTTQAHLDELAGCAEIDGQLFIDAPDGVGLDLSPLASLRRVRGDLEIGCNPYGGSGNERDCGESAQRSFTLAGLEGLEIVEGSLLLGGLPVTSLAPLGNLRTIGGLLTIVNFDSLTSLAGLEGTAVKALHLQQNVRLSTLSGLTLVPDAALIYILQMPALTDLSALAQLRSVASLHLQEMPLQNLNTLSALTGLGSLSLLDVPELSDLSGVSQLHELGRLSLTNTALENLDALRLESVGDLHLSNNSKLVEVDALGSLAQLYGLDVAGNERLVRLPAFPNVTAIQVVFVVGNGALLEGPSFPNVQRMPDGTIFIIDNSNLLRVDGFPSLEQIYQIDISRNEQLVEVDFGRLTSAETLHITCNLELPDASLTPLMQVSSSDRQLQGNVGAEALCQSF